MIAPQSLRTQIRLIDMRTHFPNICISCVLFVVMFCFSPHVLCLFISLRRNSTAPWIRSPRLRGLLRGGRSPSEGQEATFSAPARVYLALLANQAPRPGGCCGVISQDCFVTKRASREYHLDSTYLKLAPVPWQPAWQPRDGNKLHH